MLPWSPLARGLLAGNRTREGEKLTTRAKTDAFGDSLYTPEVDFAVVDRVAEVAGERGVPNAQVALAWLLHKPGVTAPIVGATKVEHLEDALAAEQLSLGADEVAGSRSRTSRTRSPGTDRAELRYAAAAARSSSSISIFLIFSIAAITRCDFSRSGSAISSDSRVGTICHDTPNRSLSQPQGPSSPPSLSLLQYESTSSWSLQLTSSEIASLKVKPGPPFSAVNRCPSSSKTTVMTIPRARTG